MRSVIYFFLIVFFVGATSCSSIKETHYFKDKMTTDNNATDIVPNYYKVDIKGGTFLSSSRYISGYFDQSAINLYFNEFTQPENGQLFGSEPSKSTFVNEEGKELVLILSTNAKAVSDQIGTIAKNQVVLNSAAAIIQKDKVNEAQNLKLEIEKIAQDKENFILKTNLYLKDINTKSRQEKELAVKQLLESIN